MSTGDDNVIQGGFSALGHAGSDSFIGLEIIRLDDLLSEVVFHSDEFTAVCPVTGQPDQYELQILLVDTAFSIESKSLKIYLNTFRNKGCFAENLAVQIHTHVFEAIQVFIADTEEIFHPEQVEVSITQKRRGGIEIVAVT